MGPSARASLAAASVEAPGPRLMRRRAITRLGLPSTDTVTLAGLRLSGARPSRSTTTRSKEIPGAAAGAWGARGPMAIALEPIEAARRTAALRAASRADASGSRLHEETAVLVRRRGARLPRAARAA